MNEEVKENFRWEEHSVGPGKCKKSQDVTEGDWRVGKIEQMADRERKMARDQVRERVELTIVICGPLQDFHFNSE